MTRLQELVLPLMLHVERRLPQVSSIRLDADLNPPFKTDEDQNAHDPMLQQIPLHNIADVSDMPTALRSSVLRARARGQHGIEGADVLCAVCAAAVEDALGNETLVLNQVLSLCSPYVQNTNPCCLTHPPLTSNHSNVVRRKKYKPRRSATFSPMQDMPADAVTYALVMYAWLTWFAAQQRKLIRLGGPITADRAAAVVAQGRPWEEGGLVVLQWGAAHNGRVERQLRGRAGRQGDPGESHVIISLEDPTMYALNESVVIQERMIRKCAPVMHMVC